MKMTKSILTLAAMVANGLPLRSGAATACVPPSAKRPRTHLGVLGLALALSHTVAMAALPSGYQGKPFESMDWPQFHGPNRDSICTETGLLQEWPEEGPKLLWKCTGLGSGYATIAIANDQLFTTGDRKLAGETNRFQYVMAFDLNTQGNLWITRIGLPGQNGACSTPTVDGPLLHVISGDGNLVCAETGTGKEVWRKSLTKDFDGKVMEQWKYSESPLVDGYIYGAHGDHGPPELPTCIDFLTGKIMWKEKSPTKPGSAWPRSSARRMSSSVWVVFMPTQWRHFAEPADAELLA